MLVSGAILSSIVGTAVSAKAETYTNVHVELNGHELPLGGSNPVSNGAGRTLVPARAISESLGYSVHWNGGTQQVILQKNDRTIVLKIGDRRAEVNGQAVSYDTAPSILHDRTYIPIRLVAEHFGARVNWKPESKTVSLNTTIEAEHSYIPPLIPQILPDQVLSYAYQFLGTQYMWGGSTPSGFDCSGYVDYVFSHFGKHLPRTCDEMYQALSPNSSLSPGDLVFFQTYMPGPSHVGIYLGNNRFISAESNGVKIASLNNPYWSPRYLGFRSVN